MLINLSEILSNPTKVGNFTCEIELQSIQFQGNEYSFTHKSPVTLEVNHVSKKKLHLSGDFEVQLSIPCGRCLQEVSQEYSFHIDKVIDFKITQDERREELDEMSFIEGCKLDVDMLVQDEILLSLPITVLCKEDCRGICTVCGTNRNESTCDCDTTVPDPRMSAIRDIFKNFKEV